MPYPTDAYLRHTPRDIKAGEEITISNSEDYDRKKKCYYRVCLKDQITAGFPLAACRCGAKYCAGRSPVQLSCCCPVCGAKQMYQFR